MRVIAGSLKGRRLEAPSWDGLRPTSDKLRETLFNILKPRIAGASFLDGYAGTGAVGIEALSRGADFVTFVETDRRAVALIQTNLRHCAVSDRYAIIRARFADVSARVEGRVFDLVFADPPYGADAMIEALEASASLVAPGGLLVLEHARRDGAPPSPTGLVKTRDLVSGDSALAFYERLPAATNELRRANGEP
jgi:16S rRNA (guanine(966)-N(2))-methyltransferase RsmD